MISGNIISQIFGLSSTKRKFLSFFNLLIASLFAFSSLAKGQNLEDGLVAWYPFDGNASDMSGNGNHGTVHGATLGVDRHGQSNSAYSFDGENDWIVLGNSLLPTNGSNWSATMWVLNPRTNSTHGMILSQYTSGTGRFQFFANESDELTVFSSNMSGAELNAFSLGNQNLWNSLVLTCSENTISLYENSNLRQDGIGITNIIDTETRAGDDGTLARWLHGSIDDIRIYNRALSEEEVGMLYEEEAPDSASFLTKVTAPDKVAADLFGANVSQSGDILAVGVYNSDPDGMSSAGAAYLYRLESNGTANYLTKVTALDKVPGDRFGASVSQSGDILAVGAEASDPDWIANAGAAYLYRLESNGTANYLTKVAAPDKGDNDFFGRSVSQSGDILAVGAANSDPDGMSNAGAAYLYRLESNGTVTYLTKVTAPDKAADDYFGYRVSQSGDILAVGAYNSDSDGISNAGAAYLYRLESNGTATYLTKVTAPDKAADDRFGYSVSQSGDILAVGAHNSDPEGMSNAGAAYLYRLESNGTATYLTKVTAPDKAPVDLFGISVSQSGDILAIGASWDDSDGISNAGATYLYRLESNNTATYLTKITAPDKAAIDYFGRTVSQSGDILVVGAHYSDPDGFTDAGAVYTFDISDYVQEEYSPVVSLRSWVQEYDALYADITVEEEITLIVRVLGPSLGTEDAASGTTFTIYDENYDELTSNSGWESSANASQLQELNLSPAHSSEAATLITLTPGVYSIEAEVSGYAEKILQLEFFSTDGQVFDKLSALESWNMYKAGANIHLIKSDVTDLTTSHIFDATDETQIPPLVYSQSALSFLETVPVGATVENFEVYGKQGFNADAATFSLLEGDNNNSFFTLDGNGTLKVATTFEHESGSTLEVQLRTTDDASVFIDNNFTLSIIKDLSGLNFERLVAVRGGVPSWESLTLRFTLREGAGIVARAIGPSLGIVDNASDVSLGVEGSGLGNGLFMDDWVDYDNSFSSLYADQLTALGLNPGNDFEGAEFLHLPAGTYEILIEDYWDGDLGVGQIELFTLVEDADKFSEFEYYGNIQSAFPVTSALTPPASDEVIDFSQELRIYENEPVGTIVGKFSDSDADGNTFTYSLVSGEGDGDNSLFTLESNGTLKTASIFDYESDDLNYSILVQSTIGGGATSQAALSIVLVDDPVDNDSDGDGLTDLEEINGYSTYELIEGAFTWEQAKVDAESRGGHLVTITSAEENAKVVAVANGLMVQIGASDSQDENVWRWVTGESFDFTNWKDGEPNNSLGDEDFLVLTNTENGTQWNDQDSGNQASYILEKSHTSDPSLADTDGDGFNDNLEFLNETDPRDEHSTPLNKGLVAWYPFDGNASDMSGNGNHGTLNGATLGTDRHGQTNKAMSFDGVDDYIESTGDFVCPKYSIGAWLSSKSDGHRTIMTIKQVDNHYNTYLALEHYPVGSSHRLRYLHRNPPGNSGGIDAYSTNSLNDGFWYYINAIHDGSVNAIFVNGEKVSEVSVTDSFPVVSGLLHVGVNVENRYFHGSIDDVRIYDRALSAEEIQLLYQSEAELPAQSVTSAKLSPALSDLIDGNGSLEQALPAGSVIARKPGETPPPGYTLFQRNEYNASLVWEQKASISQDRYAFDGADVIDGKIYFTGMRNDDNRTGSKLLERYDPATNTWETLADRAKVRYAPSTTVLDGKYYVIGDYNGEKSVEIYDPMSNSWSEGVSMPVKVHHCGAVTYEGKIYVVGNDRVIVFDPLTNSWELKAVCGLTSYGTALAIYENRIWSFNKEGVESYDPHTDTWQTEASPSINRHFGTAWTYQEKLYFACGRVVGTDGGGHTRDNTIESYESKNREWVKVAEFPDKRDVLDSVVVNENVYLIGGSISGDSKSMYSAQLPLAHPMNLYFKEGNATSEAELSTLGMADESVTLGQLAPDALAKIGLDHNPATAEDSLLAVPRGEQPPPGYAFYKRSDRNGSLIWEEKAPVSVARRSSHGVAVFDGELYFVGGESGTGALSLVEKYNPLANQWVTLNPLSVPRKGTAVAVLNGKLYAIGGTGLSSVEIFDPQNNQWTEGPSLPSTLENATAITYNDKIFLIGGVGPTGAFLDQVLCLDSNTNTWTQKASMQTERSGLNLVLFEDEIWAIGGGNLYSASVASVEAYNVENNTWATKESLSTSRRWAAAWSYDGKIYLAGGRDSAHNFLSSIEVFDKNTNQWEVIQSNLPVPNYFVDAAVIDGTVYLVAGHNGSVYFDDLYTADISPPMDLYYREANASGTITLDKLSADLVGKITNSSGETLPVGMITAIQHGDDIPIGHTLLERTYRNATHQWQEMAPFSIGRNACDGVEALAGKIYFVGGRTFASDTSNYNTFEYYDPVTNTWENLDPLSVAKGGAACAVLDGKLYVMGGQGLARVDIYDPSTNLWSIGVPLPQEVNHGTAITVGKEIYLISGRDSQNQNTNHVFCFDSLSNQWSEKASAPTTRHAAKLIWFDNRIWAIGGVNGDALDVVESYDPLTDSWRSENSLSIPRHWAVAWVENEKIYVGGGWDGEVKRSSIEVYESSSGEWGTAGEFPVDLYAADLAIAGKRVYVMGGESGGNSSTKVFAADFLPNRDLYFRSIAGETLNLAPTSVFVVSNLTLTENQPVGTVVGEFNASNPEGGPIRFQMIEADHTDHALFVLNENGILATATTFDFETNRTIYSISVRAIDEGNQSTDANFSISLNDIFEDLDGDGIEDHFDEDMDGDGFSNEKETAYGSDPRDSNSMANQAPYSLGAVDRLAVRENLPAGALVGQIQATDADGDELTYALVRGSGDSGNNSFSLSASGRLTTMSPLDFESQSRYFIRVRAQDSLGWYVEEELEVSVIDVSTPLVETARVVTSTDGSILIGGTLLDREDQAGEITVGLLLSSKPIRDLSGPGLIQKELALDDTTGKFELTYRPPTNWKHLYTRAYATNVDGTGMGLEEKILFQDSAITWGNARPLANAPGWWESPWFGSFYKSDSGWLLHLELGWVYPSPGEGDSLWLWKDNLGWVWTKERLYPFIYSNESGHWMYFFGEHKKKRLLYDYGYEEWFDLDDSKVNESVGSR